MLAVKLLQDQGIALTALCFVSPFFGAKRAEEAAHRLKIKLKIIDIGKELLGIVKKPKYGYGRNMNPCLDCHLLMLKKAKKIMKRGAYDFTATGEVLGERPMSQNRQALELIEKKSGLRGLLLRPLSAKLLDKTIPESKGWVEREKLLAIRGRSRKEQIRLAEKYRLGQYPNPAGGCLLTDPKFGQRLRKLLAQKERVRLHDVELLKFGRRFWRGKTLIVVGRRKQDNENIMRLSQKKDILMELKDYPGPLTLIRGRASQKILQKAAQLTKSYSAKAKGLKEVKVVCWRSGRADSDRDSRALLPA